MTGLEKDEIEGVSAVAKTVPVKCGFAIDSLEAMRQRFRIGLSLEFGKFECVVY